jgi:protein O-GlcNAc transferase
LIFADKVPIEDHLQRIRHADLGIDTRIVNGAATTSDALRAGVPVLTLKGGHFASRMSASILNAIGLGDLVVETGPAYVKRAVELGKHPLAVEDIKATLKINQHTKPLFDTQCFVSNLETAYITMWERHRNGKVPEMFRVSGG